VLVTDGIQGSWALDCEAGGIIHQPAFVVDPVDTTGCGDAFHAGYIVGVLEGWPLALRMEFGSLLASRVAGRVGGRTALPNRKADLIRNDISNNLRQHLML
jgi:sugar/nucleoside kinase (ribokinase family)